MVNTPTLRPFRPADRETVIDLKWEMSKYHAALPGTDTSLDRDADNSREAAADAIARDLANAATKGGALIVADVAGRVVGYLSWFVDERASSKTILPERRQVAYVGAVSVSPDLRGTGIGRALLTAVEAQARARGIKRLAIGVAPKNTVALGLYEDFGFHGRLLYMAKPLD